MTPDINILVAAQRPQHSHHLLARSWLSQARRSSLAYAESGRTTESPLRLITVVMASYLRLVTNAKVVVGPTPTNSAIEFLDVLLATPGITVLESTSVWPRLRQLSLDLSLTANAIPDALIAATVLQANEVLVTFDKDFLKLLPAKNLLLLTP